MQPTPTPYSGVNGDNRLLKFCSEGCKGFWFPAADEKSRHFASYSDEPRQTDGLLMTIITRNDNGIEQLYLYVKNLRPYLVWHIRKLECQYFAHFYISEDCLPLNSVWTKQYCTGDGEFIYDHIATKRLEVQVHIQMQLNQAAKDCGFENFEAVCKQKGFSFYDGEL